MSKRWFAFIGLGLGALLTLSLAFSQTASGQQQSVCRTNADCRSYQRCMQVPGYCTNRTEITDVDQDGHTAIQYDGDDCNDRDPREYPGNAEVWDEADHDEDCDATTHGVPPAFLPRGVARAPFGDNLAEYLPFPMQICSGNDVIIYASGVFTHASCTSGLVCVSQPSGAGVCMVPPPGHVPARIVTAPRGLQRMVVPDGAVAPQSSIAAGAVGKSASEVAFDLGRVWKVSENGWNGTWTRRGTEKVFDAVWVGPGGEQVKDELRVESVVGDTIVLRRVNLNGTYTGKIRDGGKHVDGTASWFPPAGTWSADVQ